MIRLTKMLAALVATLACIAPARSQEPQGAENPDASRPTRAELIPLGRLKTNRLEGVLDRFFDLEVAAKILPADAMEVLAENPPRLVRRAIVSGLHVHRGDDAIRFEYRILVALDEFAAVSQLQSFELVAGPEKGSLFVKGDVQPLGFGADAVENAKRMKAIVSSLGYEYDTYAKGTWVELPILSVPEGADVEIDGEGCQGTNTTEVFRVNTPLEIKIQITLGEKTQTITRVLIPGEEPEPIVATF